MQKKTPDYDNVFKTMKSKHKRLFISVINDIFGKEYPLDAKVEVLPSEGYLTESETADGSKEIEEQISDFLIKIGSEVYLLECQSYDDGSMAIRIAEYAFIVARQFATWDIGHATIPMPRFSVIYVKRTERTPKSTIITFKFPDGQEVNSLDLNRLDAMSVLLSLCCCWLVLNKYNIQAQNRPHSILFGIGALTLIYLV